MLTSLVDMQQVVEEDKTESAAINEAVEKKILRFNHHTTLQLVLYRNAPVLQNKIKRKKPQSGIILKKVEEVQQQ